MQRELIIYILQIALIYNAIGAGWKVDMLNHKTIILSKKVYSYEEYNNINLVTLVDTLMAKAN